MRHKSTVVNTQVHNQFEAKNGTKTSKVSRDSNWKKDQKEGQSEYRVEKKVGKQIITR